MPDSTPQPVAASRLALPGWADRRRDHRTRPPADIALDVADPVPPGAALGFALQHLAVQAVYLLLPLVLARALALGPGETVALLSLTLVGMAVNAALHLLPRGPVGSGYALSCIPSPVSLGAHLTAAGMGLGMAQAGPAILVAALIGLGLVLLLPGLLRLMPVEVAGVVSFSLGVSLLPRVAELGLGTDEGMAEEGFLLAALGLIVLLSVLRWRLAPFALLLGGGVGTVLGLLIWPPDQAALAEVAAQPFLALPVPRWPDFTAFDWGLVLPFLVAGLCLIPGVLGNALVLQREGNAHWVKPDPGPLQRSLVAAMLGMAATATLGAMTATTSSGGVGLAVATRVLARAVIWLNCVLLLLLACSPWLLAQMLLLPAPVAAALLLHITCFILASGAQQIASRVLDRRRTACVGLGLAAALLALLAPDRLATVLPEALLGPVTLGFLASMGVHLLTLPLVRQRERISIALDAEANREIERFVERASGGFGLRRTTADAAAHATIEVAEILAVRGVARIEAEMRHADGRLVLLVRYRGAKLPLPARTPRVEDLIGGAAAQEGFAMWLAAREADTCSVRTHGEDAVLELVFSE
ncbi:solute carrier family 23 protein [Sabulicella rubraurantiaca]|uniref:solute carrier family 23 protein n=1 Tax=Sabulicella rubraurantiaca TaxID=2811429 RepID=UPI001A97674D|nr:solute carrier family 23 protein [Sabulicella rubraurantiaca]